MAEKNKASENPKVKKKRRVAPIIWYIVAAAVAIILLGNFIKNMNLAKQKAIQLTELEERKQQLEQIKEEYNYLLDKNQRLEYIERIAREEYGYISPGERAFYDSSALN